MLTAEQLLIRTLGSPAQASPLKASKGSTPLCPFVGENDRILFNDELSAVEDYQKAGMKLPSLEIAGPRETIYFNPATTTCAIVTCGGLCPGINDVIRAIVMEAHYGYGISRILGIRFGYEGLVHSYGHEPMTLTPAEVSKIHQSGGTMLGTSRGRQEVSQMVDRLDELGVDILFVIGGDGSQKGAADIANESARRGLKLAVIGVPKTIDNDLLHVDKSFGYETAFGVATHAVKAAHTEARGSRNGVRLVKLMGRDSGFLAAAAAIATGEVNFVLIPEVPFSLDGEHGLLQALRRRLEARQHAVIVVAEGAGQDLFADRNLGTDASGNARYGDIGLLLKDRINSYFKEHKIELNLKYIDPSYIVRSVPASADDSVLCAQLGRHAVHAAMTGRTAMVVGRWHQRFVHLPMDLVTSGRRKVDTAGAFWVTALECTGQPLRLC